MKLFNNESAFNAWPGKVCDTIKGGDGAFMSPNLNQDSIIEIAVPDLCRSVKMIPRHLINSALMSFQKWDIL